MHELVSLSGIIGGAALCVYAFKMPVDSQNTTPAPASDINDISPLQLLTKETVTRKKAKGKLPVIPGKDVKSLQDISKLWKDEVTLADAADLWREPELPLEEISKIPRPKFLNEDTEEFFAEYIYSKPAVKGARRNIIVHLLKMLDSEGDCPSVVRGGDTEPEKGIPDKSFALLSKVSLRKHTLAVARLFAEKTQKNPALLPDVLIVALGHDIGKIPRHHSVLYTTADHPQISVSVLNAITEYATLPNKNDLSRAIGGHHLMKTTDTMTALLMQADNETRQTEFSTLYGDESGITAETQTPEPVPAPTPQDQAKGLFGGGKRNTNKSTNALGAATIPPSPYHPKEDDSKYIPSLQAIPAWFNTEKVLAGIEPYINTIIEMGESGKATWVAASSDGIIYVHPNTVWDVLGEIGGNEDPLFMASSVSENSRRDMLLTIIKTLAKEEHVVNDYLPEKGYATMATVVTGGGKVNKMLLVPFYAKAFGNKLPSDFEQLKQPKFTRMVKKINPKAEVVF